MVTVLAQWRVDAGKHAAYESATDPPLSRRQNKRRFDYGSPIMIAVTS